MLSVDAGSDVGFFLSWHRIGICSTLCLAAVLCFVELGAKGTGALSCLCTIWYGLLFQLLVLE